MCAHSEHLYKVEKPLELSHWHSENKEKQTVVSTGAFVCDDGILVLFRDKERAQQHHTALYVPSFVESI